MDPLPAECEIAEPTNTLNMDEVEPCDEDEDANFLLLPGCDETLDSENFTEEPIPMDKTERKPSLSTSSEPCLICLASTSPSENEPSFSKLPGSDGNQNVNKQLWSVFVLRNLLKFPRRKCADIFHKTFGVSDPASWFSLCAICKETTKRAMEVCQKILELEQEFKSFQKDLEMRFQESTETVRGGVALCQQESEFEDNIVNIRLYIRDHFIDIKQSKSFVPKTEMETENYYPSDEELMEDEALALDAESDDDDEEEEVELTFLKNDNDADDPLYIPSRTDNAKTSSKWRKKSKNRKENFCCDQCPKRYSNQDSLDKHLKLHSTSKFICHICNFPSQWELGKRIHLKRAHNIRAEKEVENYKRNGKYYCPECPGIYLKVRSFEQHRRNHIRKGSTFACKVCSYPFTTIGGLRIHMKRKHKDLYKCSSCSATFAFRSLLLKHKKEHKTEVDADCESQPMDDFQVDDDLNDMLESSKNDQDQEPEPANVNDEHNDPSGKKGHNIHCDLCGRRFTNLDAFVRHQRDHDVFREFACPKCNYPCKSAHALKIHLERKRCERKYEYKCDQCAYVTKKRYELEGHKQKHAAAAIATDCPPELIAEDSMEAELEKIGRQEPVVKKKPVSSVSFKVKCKLPLQKKKKEKVSEDEESQRFICRLCNRRYASRLSFANHRSRHELNKEFECSVCHYPCDSAVALEGHLLRKLCNTRGSLNKQKATYKCETCPYSTESEREYNKHFNTHKPKPQNTESSLAKPKPTEYTCETCPYSTESKRQYNQHLNTHKPQPPVELKLETADGRFKCRVCNQTFATLRGVTVHKRSQHPELGLVKFQCDRCPKVYTKADALRDHISKAHLKKCKYYCETCGRGMMKLSEYETHKLKHQAVKSFVCDICGSAYTYAHGLRKHLNEYHNDHSSEAAPGKFNCKFCDEKFSDRLQFNIHLKGAHQDLYVHKCEQCDSSYLSVASLQLHKRINHTLATAPVHCQFCNKQVASEVYLYSHIKNYCKKKPPGFQYSIPGVISRRKRNEEDFSNIQVDS